MEKPLFRIVYQNNSIVVIDTNYINNNVTFLRILTSARKLSLRN